MHACDVPEYEQVLTRRLMQLIINHQITKISCYNYGIVCSKSADSALIYSIVPYCPAVTPPLFATYFQEKEGGGA